MNKKNDTNALINENLNSNDKTLNIDQQILLQTQREILDIIDKMNQIHKMIFKFPDMVDINDYKQYRCLIDILNRMIRTYFLLDSQDNEFIKIVSCKINQELKAILNIIHKQSKEDIRVYRDLVVTYTNLIGIKKIIS